MPYYEFIVESDGVDARALEHATGLRCRAQGGSWRLDGELVDRAALHSTIDRMFRLGYRLVALERRSTPHTP
ncbi:MAG TPA: hypothetical protein VFI44_01215 [Ornithinibacter sp.]|nr:hypothetical protein [Ornithinibacter sp.]